MKISRAARVRTDEGDFAHRKGVGYFGYKGEDRMHAIGLPFVEEDKWRMLVRLYDRRWFERLWVVQDVAIPNRMMDLSGRGSLSLVADPESWMQRRSGPSFCLSGENQFVSCVAQSSLRGKNFVECSDFPHNRGTTASL